MVTTQIRLDETTHQQLESLASQRSTSVSQLIREGVDRVLAAAGRIGRYSTMMIKAMIATTQPTMLAIAASAWMTVTKILSTEDPGRLEVTSTYQGTPV